MVELNDLEDIADLDRYIDAILTCDKTWGDKFDALKSYLKIPLILFSASLAFLTVVWLNQEPADDVSQNLAKSSYSSLATNSENPVKARGAVPARVHNYKVIRCYVDTNAPSVQNLQTSAKKKRVVNESNISVEVNGLFDVERYSMNRKTKTVYQDILAVYQEIYPPFKNHGKADLFNKIDSNQDNVISELEAKLVLDKLNQELYSLKRY